MTCCKSCRFIAPGVVHPDDLPPPPKVDVPAMLRDFAEVKRKLDALGPALTHVLVHPSKLEWMRAQLPSGSVLGGLVQLGSAEWLDAEGWAYRRTDGEWRIMLEGKLYGWDPNREGTPDERKEPIAP